MVPRRVLKSCATPPARRPTASIFCAWRISASMLALGDVAQSPEEEALAAAAELGDREVEGEGRAVAAPSFDLPADADDVRLAGRQIAGEVAVVLVAPGLRHEDLDVLPHQLLGAVAEHRLHRGVDRLDRPRGV